jgi:hypothetical protein
MSALGARSAGRGPLSGLLNFTPLARERDLNAQIRRAEAAGGNPVGDVSRLLQENNRLQAQILAEVQRGNGRRRVPAPIPAGAAAGQPRR